MKPQEIQRSRIRDEALNAMGMALHDLCQPLTTLQCRLELAEMLGTPEALRDAVKTGTLECIRLNEAVIEMRRIVRSASTDVELGGAA